jgi:hypothetical protein
MPAWDFVGRAFHVAPKANAWRLTEKIPVGRMLFSGVCAGGSSVSRTTPKPIGWPRVKISGDRTGGGTSPPPPIHMDGDVS